MRFLVFLLLLLAGCTVSHREAKMTDRPIAIALHGGAGTITRARMTPEREALIRADLERALRAGHEILAAGGASLDAVVAAVRVLEDSPRFNAGKGAVYTAEETHELDAAVMDGATQRAGAVAAVKRVRNPIDLARLVMEKSPHVLMVSEGAERFAAEHRFELVDNSYFNTPERLEALRRAREQERERSATQPSAEEKHGTVGCVALDRRGHLAAATSTGGMTNKRFGRVGDSPLIGAGTYADDATCALSATGHGEYFIRIGVAHEVASAMRYGRMTLPDAAAATMARLAAIGGTGNNGGGFVAIDVAGNIVTPFNTEGMYRAAIDREGRMTVEIYRD